MAAFDPGPLSLYRRRYDPNTGRERCHCHGPCAYCWNWIWTKLEERRQQQLRRPAILPSPYSMTFLTVLEQNHQCTELCERLSAKSHGIFHGFPRLPAELRVEVYRYAMHNGHNAWLPLLLMSKQVNNEVSGLLKEAEITVSIPRSSFEQAVSDTIAYPREKVLREYTTTFELLWNYFDKFRRVNLNVNLPVRGRYVLNRPTILAPKIAEIMPLASSKSYKGFRWASWSMVIETVANLPSGDSCMVNRLKKDFCSSLSLKLGFVYGKRARLKNWIKTSDIDVRMLQDLVASHMFRDNEGYLLLNVLVNEWVRRCVTPIMRKEKAQ